MIVVLVIPFSVRQHLASGPELCLLNVVLEANPSFFHTINLLDKNCKWTAFIQCFSHQWPLKALYNIA